jgi:hypothetical protein
MATRSRIAIEHKTGTVNSIYCHWDGYPSNNGRILRENYMDREKVEALIKLGDISSLQERVAPMDGEKHKFESPAPGVTVAYHRDRGDDYTPPTIHLDRNSFKTSDIEKWGYLFTKDGEWVVIEVDKSQREFVDVVSYLE